MTSRRLALLLAASLAFAGCGDPPKPAAAGGGAPAPKAGVYDPKADPLVNPKSMFEPYDAARAGEDEWFISTCDNPATLNPLFASSQGEFRFAEILWANPFKFDAKMEWQINDDVTERLDISDDKKVWTLKLKPGRTWHDGHPYTAHDFEYSFKELQRDERVPVTSRDGVLRVESVKALDDLTVQYVIPAPSPMSKWDIYFEVLPKHLVEKIKPVDPTLKQHESASKFNRAPVGNGPYRFVEWLENDRVIVERWDGFKGKPGHFKRIVMKIIPDSGVQLLTFEKGQTDEMSLLAKQFAAETTTSEAFRKVGHKAQGSQWSYTYICWNQRGNPFFGDVRVRRAMTHATNIPLMIERLMYNLARPAYGQFHPESWMFNKDIKLIPFDLKESARLLDEAGWKVDPESGWRKKDGVPFSFTLLMPQGVSTYTEISAIMQQDLKSIGVEMKTQVIEWSTLQEKNRKHEFQASTAGFGTGVDPDTTSNQFSTRSIDDGRNYGCYSNPRVDELYVAGQKEFDVEKRKKIYQEIGKLIYDDQPYTFLWNRDMLWAFNKRIRGVTLSPRGVWNFDPSVMGWWVAKNEQAYR